MTQEIELTREELGALIAINNASNEGLATSKTTKVSKRLEEHGHVTISSNGLVPTPKGRKWLIDNAQKVEAYANGGWCCHLMFLSNCFMQLRSPD